MKLWNDFLHIRMRLKVKETRVREARVEDTEEG